MKNLKSKKLIMQDFALQLVILICLIYIQIKTTIDKKYFF